MQEQSTTTFVLVRHGQTIYNTQGRWQGQQNSPLTAKGEEDARRLGKRLMHEKIDAVYSSDLGRTVQTTECILEAAGSTLFKTDARLREQCFGIFEGHTKPECAEKFAAQYVKYVEALKADATHHTVAPPEGECRADMLKRGMSCLNELAEAHKGETVLVVSHGAILSTLIRDILGAPGWRTGFVMDNTSVTTVEVSGGEWKIKTLGDVAHQDGEWGVQLSKSLPQDNVLGFCTGFATAALLAFVATQLQVRK
jgi:probable phosphoglycerate mutase